MKVISFFEQHQPDFIEKILHHCGLRKESLPRVSSVEFTVPDQPPDGISLDYEFFTSPAS